MITEKEIKHIAGLARLYLAKKEQESLRKELSSILGYLDKLKKVDVSKTKPTSHPFKIENIMRPDEVSKSKVENSKLLSLVPETKDGYVKVKSIF